MAEQIDRRNKPGSRAQIKRVTAKERRQCARHALQRCLEEMRGAVLDKHLSYELGYADLISPATKNRYSGWDD